ncbi:MAG: YgiQ family radical SAM protein [Firmicutes bacterium]|nr:YgiQ family radical SAM protein [Bacillota bacterium]
MFLPVNKNDLNERCIDQLDFIVVSADAYVDHPSFGHAVIARFVESQGFSVGILAQPQSDKDYLKLGQPKHAFLISGGVVDSMVNNYTAALKKRTTDVYSEGGKAGKRPDRVVDVYSKNLKKIFPSIPIIAGGVEASLRRLSHYDYWSDSVRHSILYTSCVDLIVYGMGEMPLLDICKYAHKNIPLNKVKNILGTAYLSDKPIENNNNYISISSHDKISKDKTLYAKTFLDVYQNYNKGFIQKQENDKFAIINPPSLPPSQNLLDSVYALPFMRTFHPKYVHIPAIEEVKFSVTAHRGCFGNCSFCALAFHQGKLICSRSENSILNEVEKISKLDGFKGFIHDIGGPSANFYHAEACKNINSCKKDNCIECKQLKVNHKPYMTLLKKVRTMKGVKKVFIRSGLRFDYLLADSDKTILDEIAIHHVSGQLKVAPEHTSDKVLKLMNKPKAAVYKKFAQEFDKATQKAKLPQYLVPYFISSHPGCGLKEAVALTEYLMDIKYMPLQVQDFYPTPSTLSTTMYYCEFDPRDGQKLYVAKTYEQKQMQRALLQYRKPENREIIIKALKLAKREDLINRLPRSKNHLTKNTKNGRIKK